MNTASDSWRIHGYAEENIKEWRRAWNSKSKQVTGKLLRRLGQRDRFATAAFQYSMTGLLQDFGERCGATVVGDKWPWYIDYIEETLAAFPQARFIYNVRDPRGIWNSAQKFKQRERGDEIMHEMLAKEKMIAPYLHLTNFCTIRYEDIIMRPADSMKQLYGFLGKEYSDAYLLYNPDHDPYPQRWGWVPEAVKPIEPHHATKWKYELDQATQQRLTHETTWFIEKYGYES